MDVVTLALAKKFMLKMNNVGIASAISENNGITWTLKDGTKFSMPITNWHNLTPDEQKVLALLVPMSNDGGKTYFGTDLKRYPVQGFNQTNDNKSFSFTISDWTKISDDEYTLTRVHNLNDVNIIPYIKNNGKAETIGVDTSDPNKIVLTSTYSFNGSMTLNFSSSNANRINNIATVSSSYIFTTIADRDTYFGTTNINSLQNGLVSIVKNGTTETLYTWEGEDKPSTYNGALWHDSTALLKGEKGDTGSKPAHKFVDYTLFMENPDGTYDSGTNLRGQKGAVGTAFVPKGDWNPTDSYTFSDISIDLVNFNGKCYACLESNTGKQPDIETNYWALLMDSLMKTGINKVVPVIGGATTLNDWNNIIEVHGTLSSDCTVTLPSSVDITGDVIIVKRLDNTSKKVIIKANGTETIDRQSKTVELVNAGDSATFYASDGNIILISGGSGNSDSTIGYRGTTTKRLAMLTDVTYKDTDYLYYDEDLHILLLYSASAKNFIEYHGQKEVGTTLIASPIDGQFSKGSNLIYKFNSTTKYWEVVLSQYNEKIDLVNDYYINLEDCSLKFGYDGALYSLSIIQGSTKDKLHYDINNQTGSSLLDANTEKLLISDINEGQVQDTSLTLKFTGIEYFFKFIRYGNSIYIIDYCKNIDASVAYETMSKLERSYFKSTNSKSTKIVRDTDLKINLIYYPNGGVNGYWIQDIGQVEKDVFPVNPTDKQNFKSTSSSCTYIYDLANDYWSTKISNMNEVVITKMLDDTMATLPTVNGYYIALNGFKGILPSNVNYNEIFYYDGTNNILYKKYDDAGTVVIVGDVTSNQVMWRKEKGSWVVSTSNTKIVEINTVQTITLEKGYLYNVTSISAKGSVLSLAVPSATTILNVNDTIELFVCEGFDEQNTFEINGNINGNPTETLTVNGYGKILFTWNGITWMYFN